MYLNFEKREKRKLGIWGGRRDRENGGEEEMDCDVYEVFYIEVKGLLWWFFWFLFF